MTKKQAQVILEIYPIDGEEYVNVKIWKENLPYATPAVMEALTGLFHGAKQLVSELNSASKETRSKEEGKEDGYLPRAN